MLSPGICSQRSDMNFNSESHPIPVSAECLCASRILLHATLSFAPKPTFPKPELADLATQYRQVFFDSTQTVKTFVSRVVPILISQADEVVSPYRILLMKAVPRSPQEPVGPKSNIAPRLRDQTKWAGIPAAIPWRAVLIIPRVHVLGHRPRISALTSVCPACAGDV